MDRENQFRASLLSRKICAWNYFDDTKELWYQQSSSNAYYTYVSILNVDSTIVRYCLYNRGRNHVVEQS